MLMRTNLLALLGVVGLAAFGAAPAEAHSERIRTACTSDYLKFCGQYNPDSFQTTNCMRQHQRQLSGVCRKVLAEEGYGNAPTRTSRR